MALVLSAGGGESAFSQQGAVDWVALSNTTVSVSVNILKRLSTAGVDAVTLVVGRNVCSRFHLSTVGQSRFHDSISKLKAFSSVSEAIWFGIGVRHLTKDLASTEQGKSLLVICGSLAETCDLNVGSMILSALTKELQAPDDLRPSVQQWRTLIQACAGTFTNTRFPEILDQFLKYGPPEDTGRYKTSDPSDVACALKLVGDMCNGELRSLNICGGSSCALIAAIAYWFFGIVVEIENTEGLLVYSSRTRDTSRHTPVLTVSYSDPEQTFTGSLKSPVSVTHKSIVLRSLDELFLRDNPENWHLTSRVPWDGIFGDVFPGLREKLRQFSPAYTKLFGSAARIFEGMALGDSRPIINEWLKQKQVLFRPCTTFKNLKVEAWSGYAAGQYGSGLIDLLLQICPELAVSSYDEGIGLYLAQSIEEAIESFSSAAWELHDKDDSKDTTSMSSRSIIQTIPLLGLGMVLLQFTHLLGSVEFGTMSPTRTGFRREFIRLAESYPKWYYGAQDNPLRRNIKNSVVFFNFAYLLGMDFVDDGGWFIPLETKHSAPHKSHRSLQLSLGLFCGGDELSIRSYSEPKFSAVSINGVCCYWKILESFSDNPEVAVYLKVVPGFITFSNGHMQSELQDLMAAQRLQPAAYGFAGKENRLLEPCTKMWDRFYSHSRFGFTAQDPVPINQPQPSTSGNPNGEPKVEPQKQSKSPSPKTASYLNSASSYLSSATSYFSSLAASTVQVFGPNRTHRPDVPQIQLLLEESYRGFSLVFEIHNQQQNSMLRVGPCVLRERILSVHRHSGFSLSSCSHTKDAGMDFVKALEAQTIPSSLSLYTSHGEGDIDTFLKGLPIKWTQTPMELDSSESGMRAIYTVCPKDGGSGNLCVYLRKSLENAIIVRQTRDDPASRCLGLFGFDYEIKHFNLGASTYLTYLSDADYDYRGHLKVQNLKPPAREGQLETFATYVRGAECPACTLSALEELDEFPIVVVS